MLEAALSFLTGVLLAIAFLIRENSKEKAKDKLHELELEDSKLKAEQDAVSKDKTILKEQLKELGEIQAPSLQDSDIEKYWNKDKK